MDDLFAFDEAELDEETDCSPAGGLVVLHSRPKAHRLVASAFTVADDAPPLSVTGLSARWTDAAGATFRTLLDEVKRTNEAVGQSLPYTGLRSLLEFGIASISRIDPSAGLYEPSKASREPFMFVEGVDQRGLMETTRRILSEWLDNDVAPLYRRMSVREAQRCLDRLHELNNNGLAFRIEICQDHLLPWRWSDRTGTARPTATRAFPALADRIARSIAGVEIFEGLGPMRRLIARKAGEGNAELLTSPLDLEVDGRFSLVLRVDVCTVPGVHQPVVTLNVSKRLWAGPLRDEVFRRNNIGGTVFSRSHTDRAFGFVCNAKQEGSRTVWRPDVAFQALQRTLGLPFGTHTAHTLARREACTEAAEVLLTYRHGLQERRHPILVGIPEIDRLAAIDRVAGVVCDLGLHMMDSPRKVSTERGDSEASTRNLGAPELIEAALLAAQNAMSAADIDVASTDNLPDRLRSYLSQVVSKLPVHRRNEREPLLQQLLEANVSAMREIHPEGPPLLVLLCEAVSHRHMDLLVAAIQVLWGDSVEVLTAHIPEGAHGPRGRLPGAEQRPRDRAQLRDAAWRSVAEQITSRGRRAYCLVMAADRYLREDGRWERDDPVNKPSGRRALAVRGRARVQYLLPPRASKAGAPNVADFLQRVQTALRDLLLAHSGRFASPMAAMQRYFCNTPEAERPREVIAITIVRKNARRERGLRDASYFAVALRLELGSGRVDVRCAYDGPGNPTVTGWEWLPEGLATVASLSPARLGPDIKTAQPRFMRFVEQVVTEAEDAGARPVVIVDSTNCVRLWPWLADQRLDASNIDLGEFEQMNQVWRGVRLVRVRRDQAPSLIEDKVKLMARSSEDDERSKRELQGEVPLRVPTSAVGLFRVASSPSCNAYWAVADRTLHQYARGQSCYGPTQAVRKKRVDGTPIQNRAGLPLLELIEGKVWTGQWPTPNALEITVAFKPEGERADDIAGFVDALCYGYGHVAEGTSLPAPLFFTRVVEDYVSEFLLGDDADEMASDAESDDS